MPGADQSIFIIGTKDYDTSGLAVVGPTPTPLTTPLLHYISVIVCDWAGGQWVKIFVDRKYFLNYEPGSGDQQQSPIVLVLALYNVLTI